MCNHDEPTDNTVAWARSCKRDIIFAINHTRDPPALNYLRILCSLSEPPPTCRLSANQMVQRGLPKASHATASDKHTEAVRRIHDLLSLPESSLFVTIKNRSITRSGSAWLGILSRSRGRRNFSKDMVRLVYLSSPVLEMCPRLLLKETFVSAYGLMGYIFGSSKASDHSSPPSEGLGCKGGRDARDGLLIPGG